MDDEAGRAALNEQGAFGMGNLRYAYIVNALQDWIGDEATIREIGCQFRAINQKNDVLTVVGKVTDKKVDNGEHCVFLASTWSTTTASRRAPQSCRCGPSRAEPRHTEGSRRVCCPGSCTGSRGFRHRQLGPCGRSHLRVNLVEAEPLKGRHAPRARAVAGASG